MNYQSTSAQVTMTADKQIEEVWPGEFDPQDHYYPRVLATQLHPLVGTFFEMSSSQLVNRYCHLYPQVRQSDLQKVLEYVPQHLHWAGVDLVHATTGSGKRELVVIETNSCPSGQKSMPLLKQSCPQGGYKILIEQVFAPLLKNRAPSSGELAVIYDKNYIEASGYARAMADFYGARVFLIPYFEDQLGLLLELRNHKLHVRYDDKLIPIRAALRYVTQRPWNRIPVKSDTFIFNPLISCLVGGRNKQAASMAYDLYNAELSKLGLKIRVPETVREVDKEEVPLIVQRFGGQAVIKVPYTNAGQDVYPVTTAAELGMFMSERQHYQRFIVQSLIGHYAWSAAAKIGQLYQVGTLPDDQGQSYVADLRIMIGATAKGFRPIAMYARRARSPLTESLTQASARDMLVTNLSVRLGRHTWEAETGRLILMDKNDFESLGLGIDQLVTGFVQAVLAAAAIDQLGTQLLTEQGTLRHSLFRSINNDAALIKEIMPGENDYAHLVSLVS